MKKAEFSDFKGSKVNLKVKLSISLLNAYETMYFARNIELSEKNRIAKKVRAIVGLVNRTKKST